MKTLIPDGHLFSSRARLPEGTGHQAGRMSQRGGCPKTLGELVRGFPDPGEPGPSSWDLAGLTVDPRGPQVVGHTAEDLAQEAGRGHRQWTHDDGLLDGPGAGVVQL